MEITATQIVGFIFIIAGLVMLFMNVVGVVEGIASLVLLFIGLYFAGILK
ncbi:hypothetical protein [Saccharolobus islandicus]|jgi:hypothetical protein|nr:hypothetical protein [Sulfolobus islandicus]